MMHTQSSYSRAANSQGERAYIKRACELTNKRYGEGGGGENCEERWNEKKSA